jgi:predicted nucleotidyltransferase
MTEQHGLPTVARLREVFASFCSKHGIRRLEVFGSVARGNPNPESDVDLLVTFERPASVGELLEMAGEAEELAGAPVDFVLRESLERSSNRLAREDIFTSAVCVYGC